MAAKDSTSRLFTLVRAEDVSGTSGLGVVAEGVEFSDGTCVLHWLSQLHSIEICSNLHTVEAIHGHEGRTKSMFKPPVISKDTAWSYFMAGKVMTGEDPRKVFERIWAQWSDSYGGAEE